MVRVECEKAEAGAPGGDAPLWEALGDRALAAIQVARAYRERALHAAYSGVLPPQPRHATGEHPHCKTLQPITAKPSRLCSLNTLLPSPCGLLYRQAFMCPLWGLSTGQGLASILDMVKENGPQLVAAWWLGVILTCPN